MWPRYILSDNGTEFKNQLMDKVLQQLEIECIFLTSYHPQSNGKLEVFHRYLKPTLKKLCEKDPTNWIKYINQVLASYRVTPNLGTAETPFFLYVISCISQEQNLILNFETSFCQFPTWLLPGLRKMLTSTISPQLWWDLQFFEHFLIIALADVVANVYWLYGRCCCQLCLLLCHQSDVVNWWSVVLLLPLLVWLMVLPCGDVVTTVKDCFGWCYCQCCGWCYCSP